MAAFNLTAELNLRGPSNLNQVIGNIRRQLSTLTLDVTLNPTTSRGIQAVTADVNRLSTALRDAQTNAVALATVLRGLGATVSNLSGAAVNLNTNFTNINRSVGSANVAIKAASSEMADFGKQSALAIRRFAAFSVATGGVYALTRAISSAYAEFINFNKEFVRLQQVTDSTASGLKSLAGEITRLSSSLGVGSQELLNVSVTLAQAGLSAGETKKALEALAKSALAPSFDSLNDTVEGSIALMRQFGIGAGDLESALGSINSVAAKFAVEAGDIITAIQRTGGVFASASRGVSEGTDALNEFIAVFTSIRATTRESAETIATGLRTIFTRIQRGSTIEALRAYGISLTDLEGKFVGPYEAVKRLSQGLKSLDPRDLRFAEIVEELGGFRQIGKVIPLIQQFQTAQRALGVAQRGAGSLALDAATAQEALSIKINKVREQFIGLIRDIGQSQGFQTFVDISLKLASALISVADAAKDVLPALAAITAIRGFGAMGQFFSGFSGGISRKPKGFAGGGMVPGRGNRDTVPAMLTPGEFVIRKKAVEKIGTNKLHALNRNSGGPVQYFNRGGIVQKFAQGGRISSLGGSTIRSAIRETNFTFDKPKGAKFALTGKIPTKFNTRDKYDINIIDEPVNVNKFSNFNAAYSKSAKRAKSGKSDEIRSAAARQRGYDFENIIRDKYGVELENKLTDRYSRLDGTIGNDVVEIRSRSSITSPQKIAEKMVGGALTGKSKSEKIVQNRLTSNILTSDPNTINLGNVILFRDITNGLGGETNNTKQKTVTKKAMRGGFIQKFMAGGAAKSLKRAAVLTPQNLIIGPGHLKENEWSDTLRTIITANGLKTDIARNLLIGEQKISLSEAFSSRQLNSARLRERIGPENIAKLEKLRADVADAYRGKRSGVIEANRPRTPEEVGEAQKKNLLFGAAGMYGSRFPATQIPLSQADGLKGRVDATVFGALLDRDTAEKEARLKKRKIMLQGAGIDEVNDIGTSEIKAAPTSRGLSKFFGYKASLTGVGKANKQLSIDTVNSIAQSLSPQTKGSQIFLDFDKTLAFGADKIGSKINKTKPDYSAFGDPKQIAAGLAKAKLSGLGSRLKALVSELDAKSGGLGKELLKRMFVVSARPKNTMPLIARWIRNQGLRIPPKNVTGVGAPGMGPDAIAIAKAEQIAKQAGTGSVFIDDDPKNIEAVRNKDIRSIQYGSSISKKAKKQAAQQEGLQFEQFISEQLPGSLKTGIFKTDGEGIDFPFGLGSRIAQYWFKDSRLSGIPVDTKRTLTGPRGKIKKNIISYLKTQGYASGGFVKFGRGGGARLGARSKFKELTQEEISQLSTAQLIKYGKKLAQNIFTTGGAGIATGHKFIEVPQNRIVPELESSLVTYMGKKGFWKEEVSPLGREAKVSKKTLDKPNREQALQREIIKQADEVAARSQQWSSITSGSPIDRYLLSTLTDPMLSDYRTVRGGGILSNSKGEKIPFHYTRLRRAINKALDAYDDFNYSPGNIDKLVSGMASKRFASGGKVDYYSLEKNSGFKSKEFDSLVQFAKTNNFSLSEFQQYISKRKTQKLSNAGLMMNPASLLKAITPERFATGGSAKDTVPALLTPGEFVINKKAAKRIGSAKLHQLNRADKIKGYNTGGFVEFAAGGPTLPARPNNANVFNVVVPANTVTALQEIAKALESMGVSASSSAVLLQRGGAVSVQAAERAYQADLTRLRIAGASATDIYNMEQRLAQTREQNAAKIRTSNAFRNTSGQDLQNILTTAENERQRLLDQRRNALMGMGLSNAEVEERMADPRAQERIRQRSFETASGAPAGMLYAAGIRGGDIEQYINQSMMDNRTRKQMDDQLRQIREQELRNTAAFTSASTAEQNRMLRELRANTDAEIRERRNIVAQLRSDKGLSGGFMRGVGNTVQTGAALLGMGDLREDAFGLGPRRQRFARGFNAASAGLQRVGFGFSFAGGLLGDVAGKMRGGKEGEALSSAVSTFVGSAGIGMMFGPIGALTGAITGTIGAFKAYQQSLREAAVAETTKQVEEKTFKLQKSFEKLDKSTKKTDIANNLKTVSLELSGIAQIESTRQDALSNKIVAEQGFRARPAELQKQMQRELVSSSRQTTVLDSLPRIFEQGIAKGFTLEQVQASFPAGELDKLKELFALASGDENIAKKIADREIKQNRKESTADIDAEIKNLVSSFFNQEFVKPLQDRIKIEQAAAAAATATNIQVDLFAVTLNKISAVAGRASASFAEAQRQIQMSTGSAFGEKFRIQAPSRQQEDVLQNMQAYSVDEIRNVIGQVGSNFRFNPALIERAQSAATNQRILGEELPKILAEINANFKGKGGFDPEQGLGKALTTRLETILKGFIKDPKSRQENIKTIVAKITERLSDNSRQGITLDELMQDQKFLADAIKADSDVLKIFNELLKNSTDIIGSLNQGMNEWADKMSQVTSMRIEAANIGTQGNLQLQQALGQPVSLGSMNEIFNNTISTLTGRIGPDGKPIAGTGTLDPDAIFNRMVQKEQEAANIQQQLEKEKPPVDSARYKQLSDALKRSTLEANNLSAAHQKLQTDSSRASNALTKINELRQTQLARQGSFLDFLKNLNNPEGLMNISNEIGAFRAVMAGQMNPQQLIMNIDKAIAGLERQLSVAKPEDQDRIRTDFFNNIEKILGSKLNPKALGALKRIIESIGAGPSGAINKEMQGYIDEYNKAIKAQQKAIEQAAGRMENAADEAGKKLIAAAKIAADYISMAGQNNPTVPLNPATKRYGGVIYARNGQYVNFKPQGTDTVPAMLTPGEFVVNAKATKQHSGLLHAINDGKVNGYSNGGYVSPEEKDKRRKAYQQEMQRRRDAYLAANPKVKEIKERQERRRDLARAKYRRQTEDEYGIGPDGTPMFFPKPEKEATYTTSTPQIKEEKPTPVVSETPTFWSDYGQQLAAQQAETRALQEKFAKEKAEMPSSAQASEEDFLTKAKREMAEREKKDAEARALGYKDAAHMAGVGAQARFEGKTPEQLMTENKNRQIAADKEAANNRAVAENKRNAPKLGFNDYGVMGAELERGQFNELTALAAGPATPTTLARQQQLDPSRQYTSLNTEEGISGLGAAAELVGGKIAGPLLGAMSRGVKSVGKGLAAGSRAADEAIEASYRTAEANQRVAPKIAEMKKTAQNNPYILRDKAFARAEREHGRRIRGIQFDQKYKDIDLGPLPSSIPKPVVSTPKPRGFPTKSLTELSGIADKATGSTTVPIKSGRYDVIKGLEDVAPRITPTKFQRDMETFTASVKAQASRTASRIFPTQETVRQTGRTAGKMILGSSAVGAGYGVWQSGDAIKQSGDAIKQTLGVDKFEKSRELDEKRKELLEKRKAKRKYLGGLIYANQGTLVPYSPKGTDTVPAMLTPGEFVVNRSSAKRNMNLLRAINKGQNITPKLFNRGGIVSPKYYADGDNVSGSSASGGVSSIGINTSALDASLANFNTYVTSFSSAIEQFTTGTADIAMLAQSISSLQNLGLREGAALMANAGTSVKGASKAFSEVLTLFNTSASSLATAIRAIPKSISLTVSGSIPINVTVRIEGDTGNNADTTQLEQSIFDRMSLAINEATSGGVKINTKILT